MSAFQIAVRPMVAVLIVMLSATAAWAATRGEAEEAIAEAKAMREKAAAAGVEESQAAEMIVEAERLMPSRQYTKAQMIAYWAIRQDEFALELQSGAAPVAEDKTILAESLIAAAEAARQKAASVGGEWRDTANLIKSARTLAGAGELEKAIQAASAAMFQAERGYEQAEAEKNAGFPDYMYKAVK